MCGIAGIWKKQCELNPSEILRMSEAISHRGPDDVGHMLIDTQGRRSSIELQVSVDRISGFDLALANRRLAIIDLTSGGHQPMTRDGCTIVHNGEIYNYVELREELAALGHVFLSSSDTEVLLHAYLEWGVDCLVRLNGMFAFAIWDARNQTLFCARDRLGIKPFYYTLSQNGFIFASEIKGILAVLEKQPCVNEGIVFDFLSVGWLDHTDETFFVGIRKLPPGCYMLIDQQQMRIIRYWKVPEREERTATFEKNVETFRHLFADAVGLQMRSDVAVGCCLSGGVDSTAIVCVAAPMSPYRMRTFTSRYHDSRMDEWKYVQHVAREVPIDTISVYAEPEGFWNKLPDLLWYQEEPFGHLSVYAQWCLMRTIRANGIKVVLDGQGGDELLCGYAKYFYYNLREMWQQRQLKKLAETLNMATVNYGAHLFDVGAAWRYLPLRFRTNRDGLLKPDFQARYMDRDISRPEGNVVSQQILDIEEYSLPLLLRYEDKNSMAYSVESRVPFLDHRLVEFAVNLPSAHKLNGGQGKRVMRHALRDIIPRDVLRRRTKLGFGGNFSSWISDLESLLDEWIDSKNNIAIDRYVERSSLRKLLSRRDPTLFRYLIFDRWLERFGYV
jgi:asparagine synthase (glutamine-hydrolysing)